MNKIKLGKFFIIIKDLICFLLDIYGRYYEIKSILSVGIKILFYEISFYVRK